LQPLRRRRSTRCARHRSRPRLPGKTTAGSRSITWRPAQRASGLSATSFVAQYASGRFRKAKSIRIGSRDEHPRSFLGAIAARWRTRPLPSLNIVPSVFGLKIRLVVLIADGCLRSLFFHRRGRAARKIEPSNRRPTWHAGSRKLVCVLVRTPPSRSFGRALGRCRLPHGADGHSRASSNARLGSGRSRGGRLVRLLESTPATGDMSPGSASVSNASWKRITGRRRQRRSRPSLPPSRQGVMQDWPWTRRDVSSQICVAMLGFALRLVPPRSSTRRTVGRSSRLPARLVRRSRSARRPGAADYERCI
jgi:hypothetical protein